MEINLAYERKISTGSKVQNVGYARVSTATQNPARQLVGVDIDQMFIDVASASSLKGRHKLDECRRYCRDGDTLHVHSMDRFARNVEDLRKLVRNFNSIGVTVKFHKENLVFSANGQPESPMSKLMLSVIGAISEFERELILERQREGIAIAKTKGVYKGRKPSLNNEQAADLKKRAGEGVPKTVLARDFKISRESVYRYLSGRPEPLPLEEVMTDMQLAESDKARLRTQVES